MIIEKDIINAFKDDKRQGFRMLYDAYYRPMCVFGAKFIDDEEAVKDLVQDILVAIWDKNELDKISNLKGYLYISVRNKCLRYLKKNKLEYIEDINVNWQNDLYIDEDDPMIVQEKIRRVKEIINTMPVGCKKVFETIVISGMKYQEAADELQLSINTVKTQMKKANRILALQFTCLVLLLMISLGV